MDRDNTPVTERTTETHSLKQSRPSSQSRQISHHSDCSHSEDGKDDQARTKPLDTQEDPQPSTSFASHASNATPLRQLNMYPKVLSLGGGRGIAPLTNWNSVMKGHRCGIFINQTPQQPEIAVVPASDKIVHTDSVQIYDELPAHPRPRKPLANWTSFRLGNNSDRPTVDDISHRQLQWNMLNDNNEHGHGQRHNRPSEETESVEESLFI